MAQAAGKKCYTFSMGRVTPAKLANFPEVDVFVLVRTQQWRWWRFVVTWLLPIPSAF